MAKTTKTTKTATPEPSAERRGSTVYWPADLLKRTKKYGIDEDRELSEIVCTAVREYLDKVGAPK